MDFERLSLGVGRLGLGRHRDEIRRAAYAGRPYPKAVPPDVAERLDQEAPPLPFALGRVSRSSDGAAKAVLRLADGPEIETVLLRPSERRWTACLSSQAGCGLACSFCATGLLGHRRDLTAEEISSQALFWRRELGGGDVGPHNLVFMGMGEPLANYDAVSGALRELADPRRFGFAPSRVAVSTAGVAPGIDRFAQELPEFPLAISLHSAVDAVRDRLVPINRAYPLERLAESLRAYLARSRHKLLVEYVLLKDANDGPRDSAALIEYLSTLGPAGRLHVNLIDFNPTATPHSPSEEGTAAAFHAALRRSGLAATRRRNRGRDVAGACGQLLT